MNKICGYSCEHNKGGICQKTMCDKQPTFSTTTEKNIEELKQMIEPLKDWKYWEYSCTDEDVKKAMETKSYVEVIIEEQDKRINELKSRIEKAVEYIKEDMYSEPNELYGLVHGYQLLDILNCRSNE